MEKGKHLMYLMFCLFILFIFAGTVSATDLTGTWVSMTYSCQDSSKGTKCKIKGTLNIENASDEDTPSSFVRFYLSDDGTYDEGDRFLKQVASGKVSRGKSKAKTLSYSFGYGETLDCKYILAVIDADNTVAETNESNNTISYGPISCELGSIQGTVRDAQSQNPVQNATVSVQGTTLQTMTNSQGSYAMQNVPAGPTTVVAAASGYVSQSQTITVTADTTTTVDFSLTLVAQSIPVPPTNVSAKSGNQQATISWSSVSGANSYTLYMAMQSPVTKENYSALPGGAKRTGVTSPYIVTGLANGQTYYFVIAALNSYGESGISAEVSATPQATIGPLLVQRGDFQYLGAFRLPGGFERPATFAYGGNAMTFNPNGNPSGPSDGFPGSLFITGHDRMPYGELPNGSQFAEVGIPVPVISKNLDQLNEAGFLQEFHDAAQGLFTSLDEIPRIGIQYLSTPATGPKIHIAWGQHFQEGPEDQVPSHAWIDPNLAAPNPKGPWYIGNQSFYSVNGYMFEVPTSWADLHASGRYLGTGRFKDGGWSGKGPALFAYKPWIDANGTPAAPNTHLQETVLLLYESVYINEDVTERSLNGYQHPDEWEGGAWITTTTGKSAVLFAGTKGTGAKYWYGYINPAGPEYPCVHTEFIGQFTVCRLADGTPCPQEDLVGCESAYERGWWSSRSDAQFILYDPDSLAQVALGSLSSWSLQPYASLDIDDRLFLNPARVFEEVLGTGVQRRYRIGSVAYDRNNDLLYVLENFADSEKPVIHVWRVR